MNLLTIEVIAEERGYIFAKRKEGWSSDPEVGRIQAQLSIMLKMAGKE
jgi:hypothetical protein